METGILLIGKIKIAIAFNISRRGYVKSQTEHNH
jgi:hypothetical protein